MRRVKNKWKCKISGGLRKQNGAKRNQEKEDARKLRQKLNDDLLDEITMNKWLMV